MSENKKFYTLREEKANYLTHAFGVLMALSGTFLLIRKAVALHDMRAVTAYAIFGFGMLAAMLSSTIYHYVQKPDLKALLRHFDHGNIYVQIAASYAPYSLILLRNEGFWGWGLLALVWTIAIVGIAFNFGTMKANNHLKTASYVLMGMVVFVAAKPIIDAAQAQNCVESLYWLLAGGVFYVVGAVIYALAKREFIHAVFHVFVLLGMFCHIVSAWLVL
jgi:hemolysin III